MIKRYKNIIFMSFLALIMLGCDDVTNIITPESKPIISAPTNEEKINIDANNSEEVIASTISSIEKLSQAIEEIPRIDIDTIPNVDNNSLLLKAIDIKSLSDLCQQGGDMEILLLDKDHITVLFEACQDDGISKNGTVELVLDAGIYHVALSEFSYGSEAYFQYATIDFDERNEKKNFEAYISSGFAISNGEKVSVSDFTLNKNSDEYTANGYLSTECMVGMAQIKTVSPITIIPLACPSQGIISIIGQASALSATFNQNESIDILYNNQAYKHYESCHELPSYLDICQ